MFKRLWWMLLIPVVAYADSIHVWSNGDIVKTTDLNANFAHIHNTMVGGHGARLIDADVAGNAAIATSKLAAAPFITKAWFRTFGCVGTTTTGNCLQFTVGNITKVAGNGVAGQFLITLGYTPPPGALFHITPIFSAGTNPTVQGECGHVSTSGNTAIVQCVNNCGSGTCSGTDMDIMVEVLHN